MCARDFRIFSRACIFPAPYSLAEIRDVSQSIITFTKNKFYLSLNFTVNVRLIDNS